MCYRYLADHRVEFGSFRSVLLPSSQSPDLISPSTDPLARGAASGAASGAQPRGDDEFSKMLFEKLTLDDLDTTSNSLNRLREAEAMNAAALSSLQRQGEALSTSQPQQCSISP